MQLVDTHVVDRTRIPIADFGRVFSRWCRVTRMINVLLNVWWISSGGWCCGWIRARSMDKQGSIHFRFVVRRSSILLGQHESTSLGNVVSQVLHGGVPRLPRRRRRRSLLTHLIGRKEERSHHFRLLASRWLWLGQTHDSKWRNGWMWMCVRVMLSTITLANQQQPSSPRAKSRTLARRQREASSCCVWSCVKLRSLPPVASHSRKSEPLTKGEKLLQ